MSSWAFAFRALRSRNYRLFFSGQSISLIGTWMTRIAMSWLVYRLTDSPFLLGAVSFCGQVPAFFLAPFAGVLIDRWDRHRALVVTQALSMVQSLALAVLAFTGIISIWHVFLLAVAQGVINAFDMPIRQAFVVEIIHDRDDLSNAIALNSSMVNAARLVGPAVAGIIIAAAGEAFCFLIDGLSYIAVIASLVLMSIPRHTPSVSRRRVRQDLVEGWRYVTNFAPIRSILLLLALVSLAGMPYTVLMPVLATKVLGGGANTLGYLMAAAGVGALIGAITMAMRKSVLGLGTQIVLCSMLFGLSLIALALSRELWLSMLLLPVTGFSMMQQLASSNTILQTIVDDEKRGRVMSFYSMAFQGMAPFGSLMAGALATRAGVPGTLAISGVMCILGSIWFARKLPAIRPLIRPIYVRLGILPESAVGVQQASALQTPPQQ